MSTSIEPPLDEIQWKSPPLLAEMGGLHSNTILFYFAASPFFERTSNNAVVFSQAMNNMTMYHFIQTREAFEGRLKTMAGLEFVVGEEPAETGPGMGTGVWVIRKQTRKKSAQYDRPDEITIHASYFVVGEHIYMAPRLSDILASRLMTISASLAKALPNAASVRKWHPATGHVYQLPSSQSQPSNRGRESKDATPAPDAAAATRPAPASQKTNGTRQDENSLERAAEEAFMIHMRYGGDYIDKNPITGRPGEFHLSSTGRKPALPPSLDPKKGPGGGMNGPTPINTKLDTKKDGKTEKTPKSATMPKPKRKKSRISAANTPAAT